MPGVLSRLNLRPRDLVNMAVARYAQAPVLLVGDIACGGIFAQLLGTLWLFTPEEQALVQGLVVTSSGAIWPSFTKAYAFSKSAVLCQCWGSFLSCPTCGCLRRMRLPWIRQSPRGSQSMATSILPSSVCRTLPTLTTLPPGG